jgi:DNA-directed RNA polymerase subunit F
MVSKDNNIRLVSLSEVKNILKKLNNDRKELLYEQRIALEHAQKFSKLTVKKSNDMIKELTKLEFLEKSHSYKIANLIPNTKDDVKAIFAKERISLGDNEIKKILDIVAKYYIE